MKTKPATGANAVDAVRQLVDTLMPLSAEDRRRAISAATILLGDPGEAPRPLSDSHDHAGILEGISPKASAWMGKNGLSRKLIDHVFSIEGGEIDVIASKMPGSSRRQQTVEAYLMCGLRSFIQTGEVTFPDKDARALCQKVGCYDSPNHSNYMRALGNRVIGSKDSGWKLTNPGLSEAAHIVKRLTENAV